MVSILISAGQVAVSSELLETPTAKKIQWAQPIYARAQIWGEAIYFSVEVASAEEHGAKDIMKLVEITFWPSGNGIAIGFGQTPASMRHETRLVRPCNVWAQALYDVHQLARVRDGDDVAIIKADR